MNKNLSDILWEHGLFDEPVADEILKHVEEKFIEKEKEEKLGCIHGRQAGEPCPHCLGVND